MMASGSYLGAAKGGPILAKLSFTGVAKRIHFHVMFSASGGAEAA